jgi:hypothetical protein
LICVPDDVLGDLGLQRRREHLAGTIADNLVQQRPPTGHAVVVGLDEILNLEHGRTFPPALARWT